MIPQEYFRKVRDYFNGDASKAWLWFKTNNPHLGGVSPLEMIKNGRFNKLKLFIDSRLEGYLP